MQLFNGLSFLNTELLPSYLKGPWGDEDTIISVPSSSITLDMFSKLGYYPYEQNLPIPSMAIESWNIEFDGEKYVGVPVLKTECSEQELTFLKVSKYQEVHNLRKERLNAGFFVDGILFDSDQSARIAYSELAIKFMMDPTYSTIWKASGEDWVTMNKELFDSMSSALETHISSAFLWQQTKNTEIESATSLAELNAISLTGWN